MLVEAARTQQRNRKWLFGDDVWQCLLSVTNSPSVSGKRLPQRHREDKQKPESTTATGGSTVDVSRLCAEARVYRCQKNHDGRWRRVQLQLSTRRGPKKIRIS